MKKGGRRHKGMSPARRQRQKQMIKQRQVQRIQRELRQKQKKRHNMPAPPRKRSMPSKSPKQAKSTASSSAQQASLRQLQMQFDSLNKRAQLETVYDAIARIDNELTQLPFDLTELRQRGYVHGGLLDDKMDALDKQWDGLRPQVEQALRQQVRQLDRELDQLERRFLRLDRPNNYAIEAAESQLRSARSEISSAQRTVETLYTGIERDIRAVRSTLRAAGQMLDWIVDSAEIELTDAEGPIIATEAIWQHGDEEGMEGILLLTDLRLMFEQVTTTVTNKRLGLFGGDKSSTRRLQVELGADQLEGASVETESGGGLFGRGKRETLFVRGSNDADYARLQFRLKSGDEAVWVQLIERVRNGDIDADRDDEFVEEAAAAQAAVYNFPTSCPNCFAALPMPKRGDTHLRCEYCGSLVKPMRVSTVPQPAE